MKNPTTFGSDTDRYAQRIAGLRQALNQADPFVLAKRTGATYQPVESGGGEFQLALWGHPMAISFPGYIARRLETGEEASIMDQALLLYYFNTADGAPSGGRWIAFSELPDGRFYNQAFQGYTGGPLSRSFQSDQARFEQAAGILKGTRQFLGDASFVFQALPRIELLVVYWQGDEDFPASFQILFDDSASHYLPTDAFAILGSTLVRRLTTAR